MSTGVVAASAAAVAMYWYLFKQKGLRDDAMEPVLPIEACRNAPDHAPSNWSEALYHVKEVLRYMYNETLGRWHTIDLFVGLAYLSHRETIEYPAADIAAKGAPVMQGYSIPEQLKLMLELQEARRYMLYCKGLKLRREEMQARFWKEHLGADTLTIVKQQPTAGVLRPAYVVISDHALRCVVLCIRGTHSMKDLFTSLAGAAKPHHVVDPESGRLVLGYSHLGMLAAARWLARQATPVLRTALEASPGYQLRIVGHSMGGGTAALLTMMYRGGLSGAPTSAGFGAELPQSPGHNPDQPGAAGPSTSTTTCVSTISPSCVASDPFLSARCVSIACPSVVTLELAAACREYVTSIVNGTDIVPTFCAASVDKLREDVTRSSWFSEFSRDMRSGVVRALQGGVRGVGTATQWTSRNILQPAVVPFRACYATTTSRKVRRRAGASATSQPAGAVAGAALTTAAAAAAAGGLSFDGAASSSMISGPSSPHLSQLMLEAEQREQLLLAAGAGGGAAAAAAAAVAAAALDGSAAGGMLPPSTAAAAMSAWGDDELVSGSVRPPGTQSMSSIGCQRGGGGASGVDQRAMAEAVQSCMYAVNSAVSAHHHHHHHQHHQPDASDPAFAEALGLLESLPHELDPGGSTAAVAAVAVAASAGAPVATRPGTGLNSHSQLKHQQQIPSRRSLEALDAADLRRRPAGAAGGVGGVGANASLAADSLLASSAAAVLGAGGVSTAMVYGNSLRRRLWPWGHAQAHDGGGTYVEGSGSGSGSTGPSAVPPTAVFSAAGGGGCLTMGGGSGNGCGAGGAGTGLASGSVNGSYSSLCDHDGGGCGAMMPPRVDAPDSPGKAKAAAAPLGGVVGGSMAALASTKALGDWLWRGGGMLFTTCTTPRRAMSAAPGGLDSAAAGLGTMRGGGSAWRATSGSGSGSVPLLIDLGDEFDDESDPDEEGDARERRHRSAARHNGSSNRGEDEGEGSLGSDDGSDGEDGGDSTEDEEEEEGDMGVSGPGRSGDLGTGASGAGGAFSSAAAVENEQQLQAGITAVVAAVTNQASREAAEGPSALLRDENTLAAEDVLREVREADAAAAAGSRTPSSSRPRRRETLRRREPRRAAGDCGAGSASRVRAAADAGGDGSGGGGGGHAAAVGASGGGDPGVLGRASSDAALSRGGGGGGEEEEEEEEDEAPLSPGDSSTTTNPLDGSRTGPGTSSAEYEARLYKRRLYPAGRILHLFPRGAISGQGRVAASGPHGDDVTGSTGGSAVHAACTNPMDAAAARVSVSQAPHVLYEVQDPKAYSRVRLCRTMVSDHLIPAYLAALDCVLSQMEEQQQRAAMDAWDRELEREQQELELQQQQQQQNQQQQEQ